MLLVWKRERRGMGEAVDLRRLLGLLAGVDGEVGELEVGLHMMLAGNPGKLALFALERVGKSMDGNLELLILALVLVMIDFYTAQLVILDG